MIVVTEEMIEKRETENPVHYVEGREFEPKDVIRDWDLNFNLGNAVKYISRNGRKKGESAVKDLQKAIQYLHFEIDALKKEMKENSIDEKKQIKFDFQDEAVEILR